MTEEQSHQNALEDLQRKKRIDGDDIERDFNQKLQDLQAQLEFFKAEGSSNQNDLQEFDKEIEIQKQELEDNVESVQKQKENIEAEKKETERLMNIQAEIDGTKAEIERQKVTNEEEMAKLAAKVKKLESTAASGGDMYDIDNF